MFKPKKNNNFEKDNEFKISNGVRQRIIKTIIINFPTNIGDAIISLPVLDKLRFNYPQAKITAIVSPQTKSFLLENSFIDEVVEFDKSWKFQQKIKFVLDLRGKYDLIIDLKNSFLPVVLGTKQRSTFLRNFPKGTHVKDEYLRLVRKIAPNTTALIGNFNISLEEKEKWDSLNIKQAIFIACFSRSHLKTYTYEYLKKVVETLSKRHKLVILGLKKDSSFYKDILTMANVVDLTGQTSMNEVFYLLKNYASLALCVDSSIMHAASYLNQPIVAIFGPTDPKRYGPWTKNKVILRRKELSCAPCGRAQCDTNIECMCVSPKRVVEAVEKMLYVGNG
ncbi:MAG: glycosyltransferase family 9 protein [Candidatus Omnitrophota bacterium]